MTREEALFEAKNVLDEATAYEDAVCYITGDDREWLAMAIKALEQEHCEDAISRQAAIDAVRENTFRLTFAEEQSGVGHVAWSAEAVYSDVIEGALLELPSITPQQKTGHWIKSTGYDDRDCFYTCSECGRNINLICGAKLSDYPYCHCGAKMQEVEE